MPRLLSAGLFCSYRIHSARGFRILIARVSAGENESRPDGVVSSLKLVDHKKRHRRHRLRPRAAASIGNSPWARLRALPTARQSRAGSCGVECKSAVRDERNKKQESLEVKFDPEQIETHATEKKKAEITDNNARLRPDRNLHSTRRD